MLVLSQVILSLQLPFAIFPLVLFTGNAALMGKFTNPRWLNAIAWAIGLVITGLNVWLLWQTLLGG